MLHTLALASRLHADGWMNLLIDWAVIGGFCLALAGSVVTVIGFVVTLKVTQHDHARRLVQLENSQGEAALKMERMARGIAALLERTAQPQGRRRKDQGRKQKVKG